MTSNTPHSTFSRKPCDPLQKSYNPLIFFKYHILSYETCGNCQSPKSFPNKLFPFFDPLLMTQGLKIVFSFDKAQRDWEEILTN